MKRPRFLATLARDPVSWRTFVAACAALLAVGLDPQLLDPGLPTVRAALRAAPELQSFFAASAVLQVSFILLGGFFADAWYSQRLVRLGLAGLVVASVLGILFPESPGLLISRVLAWACTGIVLPFAIGSIALAYRAKDRALALGVAYGVLGLGAGLAPFLASVLGALGPRWPAFAACAGVSAIAVWVWWRHPLTPRPSDVAGRTRAGAVALAAFGLTSIFAGAVDFGDSHPAVRLAMVTLGGVAMAASIVLRRDLARTTGLSVNAWPLGVALLVGAAIGFAQAVPLLHLPLFFRLVQGADPVGSALALAPFVIALLVAGPVTDVLIRRLAPRDLIVGGLIAVGVANLGLAAILTPATSYIWFVLPFVLVGAGFVISTSVRTAVIFASMPSRLPSSAAAINETSVGLGSRLGVVVATLVMTQVALRAFGDQHEPPSPEALEALLAPFRDLLQVIGLPSFEAMIQDIESGTLSSYFHAATEGIRASLFVAGGVAVVAAAVAYPLLGRTGALGTTWDMKDERGMTSNTEIAA